MSLPDEFDPDDNFGHAFEPEADIDEDAASEALAWQLLLLINPDDEDAALPPVSMPAMMHSMFTRNVVPSFVVDVSDFVTEKMKAIRAYASQFFNEKSSEPETRISERGFLEQIEVRMGYFGSLIGVSAGEAFYVREALNVDDPIALLTRPMNIYS